MDREACWATVHRVKTVRHDWSDLTHTHTHTHTLIHVNVLLLFSHIVLSSYVQPHGLQHGSLPSFTVSWLFKHMSIEWWFHPTISSSITPFSSCPQSFPAGSFPVSQLFTSGGQNIGVSASALVLPRNIQGWFPLGLTNLILLSKGLSRVFSIITFQKHQFFGTQPSLWSNSNIHTCLLEKP